MPGSLVEVLIRDDPALAGGSESLDAMVGGRAGSVCEPALCDGELISAFSRAGGIPSPGESGACKAVKPVEARGSCIRSYSTGR